MRTKKRKTVYFGRFTGFDLLIMSQLEDCLLFAFYSVWLTDNESVLGPYTLQKGSYTFHKSERSEGVKVDCLGSKRTVQKGLKWTVLRAQTGRSLDIKVGGREIQNWTVLKDDSRPS